jgi:hypothetical protein
MIGRVRGAIEPVEAGWRLSRRRLLGLAGGGVVMFLARGTRAFAAHTSLITKFRVAAPGRPFVGDSARLATLGGANRRRATLHFTLSRRAAVSFDVLKTGQGAASEFAVPVAQSTLSAHKTILRPGEHTLEWEPPATLPSRTYIVRLRADLANGRTETAHGVVRLLGVDAAFSQRSALPGEKVTLVVNTDAHSLSVQMIHSGPETFPTYVNNVLPGVPAGAPLPPLDWRRHVGAPAPIEIEIDPNWPSGLYAAAITADDGRVGYAPIIVRPLTPRWRVAVVMPTSTWAAYNFYDANGDGWGDTWYARWQTDQADMSRPQPNRGVPYRFRSYDLAFQHWLAQQVKRVDLYADEDLERFPSAQSLRQYYDLLVFPGHTEYVTKRVYDLTQVFRDLGGNLMFLSANNFFRKVERQGHSLRLVDEWRDLGRPEAALLGNQYLASDRGQRRAPFTVIGAESAPWAFAGTGLGNGSTFGKYGIEIDARTSVSPANTIVLAQIPDLFGPGRTAEMTYYEHSSGARVFSAGVLDFGGQALLWPETAQMLTNIWNRLAPSGY